MSMIRRTTRSHAKGNQRPRPHWMLSSIITAKSTTAAALAGSRVPIPVTMPRPKYSTQPRSSHHTGRSATSRSIVHAPARFARIRRSMPAPDAITRSRTVGPGAGVSARSGSPAAARSSAAYVAASGISKPSLSAACSRRSASRPSTRSSTSSAGRSSRCRRTDAAKAAISGAVVVAVIGSLRSCAGSWWWERERRAGPTSRRRSFPTPRAGW